MQTNRSITNIVLVGFMGTGKTAVGVRLAEMLQMELIDTDDIIEADSGMVISRIIAEMGGEHFRDLESKAVEKVCKLNHHIISTGGGVVVGDKNIQNLKRTGLIFCLDATPEVIWQRVSHETHRPLLQVEDPMGRIREMLETRKPFYDKADYKIDTSQLTIEQVAEKIVELFRREAID
jgi:shikimate kinase